MRQFAQDGTDRVGRNTPHHGYHGAFTSVRGLVGQEGIYLAIAQTCPVKAQILSDIIREKQVFIRMLQLISSAVIAYNLLVWFAQPPAV